MMPQGKHSLRVLRRLWPLAALVALTAACLSMQLHHYLSFDFLRENRDTLVAFVHSRPLAACLVLGLIYIVVVACSLPGATILTLTCGFLFGQFWGTLLAVTSATAGATLLFAVASTSFGSSLRFKANGWVGRFQEGFRKSALIYLLLLRLVPLFPFVVVNLVPAILRIPLRTFILATFVGCLPGSFVYASFGTGLSSVFEKGGTVAISDILTPEIVVALSGLALLTAVPLLYRKYRAADPFRLRLGEPRGHDLSRSEPL